MPDSSNSARYEVAIRQLQGMKISVDTHFPAFAQVCFISQPSILIQSLVSKLDLPMTYVGMRTRDYRLVPRHT